MKTTLEYRIGNHSKGNAVVHLVWIPKRRKKVLSGEIAKCLRQIIYELAKEKDWDILSLEVAPDHVHLFVEHQPDVAINQVVKAFKGRSSSLLRRKFPELLKLPSLWTNSYFYSTAGQVSADVIKRYIEDPRHG
ncbi:IS200/IS605 family transposase [Cylindrospermopsis raciborskii CHAB3438]|jgi:putative transposase|uniref:IS200/IS605 family transposase n=1 Tax=Cylindrospermopsis TaxID=77021 RepID=UPI00070ADAE5|nr:MULTISPECIES: IS200/IS605 family transposase [Cylindrospermopsis]MBU6345948.1 IS200/IS605 family transposase [Cyanobacteria bacterium REEB494]KRH97705.1 transposase [Cylindrospermopsis sp. CR12]MCH4903521.1 IS200/IS605 family transposase [Cylindrospermopsis raciborskii CHAB3438]TPX26999.1 IS200/IS605 family transposase [Cylindrospermopsis raciborskii GIHE 2018]UJL33417.1 IS200/IS605 family transposase [Cylindrospermopsis raciborskii Cr2010]